VANELNEIPKEPTPLLSWEFPEYETAERSPLWYMIAVPVAIGLLIWAILSANYLFTVIILFSSILLLRQHRSQPERLTFSITDKGIDVHGRHFFPFADIRAFWILNDELVKKVYFEFKTMLRPRLTIPLEGTDPEKVRALLAPHVTEDKEREEEPTTDAVARALKL
jgi:hypothetical protein